MKVLNYGIGVLFLLGCQPSFVDIDGENETDLDSGSDLVDDEDNPTGAYVLYINEFMASNSTITFDGMTEEYTPDWIEIYNDSDRWVNLSGFEITDDLDGDDGHILPDLEIEPRGYLVLFADGEPEAGPQHLNFKLSSEGESIALFSDAGIPLDQIEYIDMLSDISAARIPDGGTLISSSVPTPGTSNQNASQ